MVLVLAAIALLQGGCVSGLQPKRHWAAAMRSEPLSDVQVESEGAEFRGRGSGVILHSSEEHGTFILTCGHVTCVTDDIRHSATLGEFAADVGKVTDCSGATVAVRVHESSADGRAGWKEWAGFQGDVIFSKHVIERWPQEFGEASFEFGTDNLPDLAIMDIALVHLRTGAEPLSAVTTLPAETGAPAQGSRARIRGISYFHNRPYEGEVVLLNDRLFGIDGSYCSGSGLYGADGRLVGIYAFRSGLSEGELTVDGERHDISSLYYFVPLAAIRAELEPRGLGFLFD